MAPTPHPPEALPRLLDERHRPDFRDAFGRLASTSSRIDVAVGRIRLTTLDLGVSELAGLESIRLLLAEVRADLLDAEARTALQDPARATVLRHLIGRLRAGDVEVRAAPLGGWSPDFTVFHHREEGARRALLGPHWLERPYALRGPAWASLHGVEGARLAGRRFERIWASAHDVSPALGRLLGRALDDPRSGPAARLASR